MPRYFFHFTNEQPVNHQVQGFCDTPDNPFAASVSLRTQNLRGRSQYWGIKEWSGSNHVADHSVSNIWEQPDLQRASTLLTAPYEQQSLESFDFNTKSTKSDS